MRNKPYKANIIAEASRAQTAEAAVAENLTAEVTRAKAAEQASASAITAEVTRATTAENGKVDKVSGKGLSTEDYTTAEKTKLAGIATGRK